MWIPLLFVIGLLDSAFAITSSKATLDCSGHPQDRLTALKCALRNGTLVHPLSDITGRDMMLAALTAQRDPSALPWMVNAEVLKPNVEHTVFVLVDGMGMDIINRTVGKEPTKSFLKENMVSEVNSAFPSSTTPNLISLGSGDYPSQHGVLGWIELVDQRPIIPALWLDAINYTHMSPNDTKLAKDAFHFESVIQGGSAKAKMVYQQYIDTPFAKAVLGNTPGVAINASNLTDAINLVPTYLREVHAKGETSFTFIYITGIDYALHALGVDSPVVDKLMRGIDGQLGELWRSITYQLPAEAKTRMIVSADHGQINIDHVEVHDKQDADKSYRNVLDLGGLIKCIPTVEARSFALHLVDGITADEARERIRQEAPDVYNNWLLLTPDELVELELFGLKEYTSDFAKSQMGDLFGISLNKALLTYYVNGISHESWLRGQHGGLLPEEVKIPFMVVDTTQTIVDMRTGYKRLQTAARKYFDKYKYKDILVEGIKYPVIDGDAVMDDKIMLGVPLPAIPAVLVNFTSPPECDGLTMPATAPFCIHGHSKLEPGFHEGLGLTKFLILANYFDTNIPVGSPAESVLFGINATFKGHHPVHLEQLEGGCATIIDQSMYLGAVYLKAVACTADLDHGNDLEYDRNTGKISTSSNFTVYFEVHLLGITVVEDAVWAKATTFAGDNFDLGVIASLNKTFNKGGVGGAKCDAAVTAKTVKNRINLWHIEATVDVMVWVGPVKKHPYIKIVNETIELR
ncbi:hypothetical protein FOL47_005807 [Perkinsus chesapeaki]|uniref:Ectonucleotide pyrophosphatase phosphodiesterase n=1 Tax=Perkinsus chesapeaki TaxID=330153 RepID=A0A7J6LVT8_PERCH|nr:hypothetical protein FOL47_005807 [Perkinsus chesapeaki]